jgi:hypothetical protein
MTKPIESGDEHLSCLMPVVEAVPLPPGLGPEREHAITLIQNKWVNGTVLRFHFLASPKWNWPAAQMKAVRDAFAKWKAVGIGLSFLETNDPSEAEIRIGFWQGDGSWSYVGTDILKYSKDGRTMNFGWDLTTEWGGATALHEIGHTLGMPHEHQNPNSGIVWNEARVYQVFGGPPNNWKPEQTFHNIIRKLNPAEVEGTGWDPTSVMHYPFQAGLISAPAPYDAGVPRNTDLSDLDKAWVATVYPPLGAPQPIAAMQFERLMAADGEQRDFVIVPEATRDYVIQTVGQADCKVVIFEERDGEPRYFAAEDDSGEPANATLKVRLVKDRRYIIRVRIHYLLTSDGVGLLVA